jgi:biopolymer transport protein ExbD
MRIRNTNRSQTDIKLDLTSMIDIVFQLLVYFIMTFKITAMEGDFNINMPTSAVDPTQIIDPLNKTIEVHLTAGEGGAAGPIEVKYGTDSQVFSDEFRFMRLRDYVKNLVLQAGDPLAASEFEVEFDIDRGLHYDHTVKAVEAVSGETNPDGRVATLIKKIRFRDNRAQ